MGCDISLEKELRVGHVFNVVGFSHVAQARILAKALERCGSDAHLANLRTYIYIGC